VHLHNPTDNHPPNLFAAALIPHMAKTSRDPFSPLIPMKKKVKKAAVEPAAHGTQKKKKTVTTSAKQNLELLSDLDEESIFPIN